MTKNNNINSKVVYKVTSIFRFTKSQYKFYRETIKYSDDEYEVKTSKVICELYQTLYN